MLYGIYGCVFKGSIQGFMKESRGMAMENNIFGLDWHYKKYYLGFISNSPASMDLFFYSHEQRYIVKVRSSKGKINTVIEAVEEFKLTKKQGESFCINVDYQKPSAIQEVYYRNLPENLLEELTDSVFLTFPKTTSWKHFDDVVLFDSETEMVVPFQSEKSEEYEDGGLDQKADGYLIGTTDKNLKKYPEWMVSQLQGKPSEDMYKIYDVFKCKKVVLLGVSYLEVDNRNYYPYVSLYFLVDKTLYTLKSLDMPRFTETHWRLEEVLNVNNFESGQGSNKAEFYFYGKEVEIAEYHLINYNSEKCDKLWEMADIKVDLKMPRMYSYFVKSFLASDDLFVFSLDESNKCTAQILISKMEHIEGSSYSVKRKRFLQKLTSIIES